MLHIGGALLLGHQPGQLAAAGGAFLEVLEGKTLLQAVNRGNKIGSLAIQVQGDSEGLPTRDALGE